MYVIIHRLAVSLTGLFAGDGIMDFQLTPESAGSAIAQADASLESLVFATIIKNRVNRGDVLASGARFIKNGDKFNIHQCFSATHFVALLQFPGLKGGWKLILLAMRE